MLFCMADVDFDNPLVCVMRCKASAVVVVVLVVVLQYVVVVHRTSQTLVRTSSAVSGQNAVPGRGRSCLNETDTFRAAAWCSTTVGS